MSSLMLRRLESPTAADSDIIQALAHVLRDSRAAHLSFINELHSEQETRAFLSGPLLATNHVWVAHVDGEVAGFVAFAQEWVNQLSVAPRFQGRGVGSKLLEAAKATAATLDLWVFQINQPAIRFYEKHGFVVVERTAGAGNEAGKPDARMRWIR